jgi:hypothetical protein
VPHKKIGLKNFAEGLDIALNKEIRTLKFKYFAEGPKSRPSAKKLIKKNKKSLPRALDLGPRQRTPTN